MSREAKPWFYKQTGWWMAWIGGRKQKLAKGKANKKAAKDRLEELRVEARKNPPPGNPDQTVASVIETYQEFENRRLAPSTAATRGVYLQSFAEVHGWRLVCDSAPLHLKGWLNSHPEWKSDWTKNGAIRYVQIAFNWAAENKLIPTNPFKGVTHREGQPRRNTTPEEFHRILRGTVGRGRKRPTPGMRIREVLYFLWLTGCRPGEASHLRWSNVDFDRGLVVIMEHKTSKTQKVPKPRIIPMHAAVVRLLHRIRKRNEGDLVFLTHRKTPWNKDSLGLRIRRARKIANVPDDAKLYGLRHAFGTRAIVNGVGVKTLSELLGHTTTRMSERYVHLAGQYAHLADAMSQVNARRRGA
jgi:integrase